MVFGYKCFNSDLTNCYNFKFKLGNSYHIDGTIKFGIDGNGFHMCERLEDTLRYFGSMNIDISICEVVGSGDIVTYSDDYNEYYDMYSVSDIKIIRKLERDEIIHMMLNVNENRVIRFIQFFKLLDEEIDMFEKKFCKNEMIINTLNYYQKGEKNAYSKKYIK